MVAPSASVWPFLYSEAKRPAKRLTNLDDHSHPDEESCTSNPALIFLQLKH